MKKILYIDMDDVLVDFQSGLDHVSPEIQKHYQGRLDQIPHVFSLMKPIDGAIDAFHELSPLFDTFILSTAPWENPTAWGDKLEWVKSHLGQIAHKRLILSHHKNLNDGDFLIDDRKNNGVDRFKGEHIHFGTAYFPDWSSVTTHLRACHAHYGFSRDLTA